jgi:hypothetical protein
VAYPHTGCDSGWAALHQAPCGPTRDIFTPHCTAAACGIRMADAGDAMPRSLVERLD